MKTLVVVSKYDENIEWIKGVKYECIIYDKSPNPIKASIPLPNIGREAGTLLHYITTNYTNLPDLTIFLQGDPRSNPISYTYDEVINEINKEHPYELKTILTWEGRTLVENYWLKTCAVLERKLFDETDGYVTYSSGVQYVIPKDVILNRPLGFYQMLYDEVLRYGNLGLEHNRIDLSNGIDAWTIELVWGSIFDKKKKLKEKYE